VSQEEIANLSGFSRQRCSKTLVTLREAGIISTSYGRIRVLDLEKLRSIAENGFASLDEN
jgi:predicted transcriptional regulator